MATSNSFDYSVTAADAVQSALEKVNAVVAGESVDSDDQALALRELNKLVKQWSHPSDGSEGMKVWLRRFVYMFLAEGQRVYLLGPSGDEATESYTQTTIRLAEASGQTVLDIVSSTGMTAADIIGIELDDGTLQWTTIVSTGAGPVVTIAVALTAAAAVGNRVFWYTPVSGAGQSVPYRPVEIIFAVVRNVSDNDTPIDVFQREQWGEFEMVSPKTTEADIPVSLFYEPKRTQGQVTLDSASGNVTYVIRMLLYAPVDDLDAAANDLAFPQEWFSAVEWELAKRLSTSFSYPWTQTDEANWSQATVIARKTNPRGFTGGFRSQDSSEFDPSL